MNLLSHYLDELKIRMGLNQDKELAQFLGLSPQDLNRARKKGYLTDLLCFKVAQEIGVSPARVIAAREMQKAKDAETKRVWKELFDGVTGLVIVALAYAAYLALPHSGDAIHYYELAILPTLKITGNKVLLSGHLQARTPSVTFLILSNYYYYFFQFLMKIS